MFRCEANEMVVSRTIQLEQFAEYLDKQDISRPVKQCLYAGMTGWLQSNLDKPVLHAPTRGRLMPADQLATKAFVHQTAIGWDALFRGQLSSSWRKAILFSSSIRDEDATEQYLQRIIKKLHAFSLAIWASPNGILHGNTRDEKREARLALIRSKVTEAYELYAEKKLILLSRDTALFRRKTLEERLKGDEDMLFCWLRSVEVALAAYEKQQAKAARMAKVFFQPFREMGKRRLVAQRMVTMFTTTTREVHSTVPDRNRLEEPNKLQYARREEEQLTEEVSEWTQNQYKLRSQQVTAVDGLADTIWMDNEADETQHEMTASTDESI